jgi:hypothetical protein
VSKELKFYVIDWVSKELKLHLVDWVSKELKLHLVEKVLVVEWLLGELQHFAKVHLTEMMLLREMKVEWVLVVERECFVMNSCDDSFLF